MHLPFRPKRTAREEHASQSELPFGEEEVHVSCELFWHLEPRLREARTELVKDGPKGGVEHPFESGESRERVLTAERDSHLGLCLGCLLACAIF